METQHHDPHKANDELPGTQKPAGMETGFDGAEKQMFLVAGHPKAGRHGNSASYLLSGWGWTLPGTQKPAGMETNDCPSMRTAESLPGTQKPAGMETVFDEILKSHD